MKKLFLLLLVLPLAFFACGDDDNGEKEKDPAEMTAEEFMKEDRPFKWNGDWNDPDDINYKKDGYNPLADTYWVHTFKNSTIIFHFTKDLEFVRYNHQGNNLAAIILQTSYIINDKMLKDDDFGYVAYFISEDGKSLYYNRMGPGGASLVPKIGWETLPRFYPEN